MVIASHRQGRTFLPPADECPLDPSRDGRHTEIPAADYEVVVFENRFPSLSTGALLGPDPDDLPDDDPLFTRRAGLGRCEVVCFTSDHSAAFSSLPPERVDTVLRRLGRPHPRPERDARGRAGLRVREPGRGDRGHALPPARPDLRLPVRAAADAPADRVGPPATGSAPASACTASLLAAERHAGTRIVAENDLVTVVVPHAARWPYEAHVYPRRHVPDLPALTDEERRAWPGPTWTCCSGSTACSRRRRRTSRPGMQAPARADRELMHLHAEVFSIRRAAGKLKYLAGSESGAEVWINDISPEGGGRGPARRDPAERRTGAARRSGPPLSRWCEDSEVHVPAARQVAGRGRVLLRLVRDDGLGGEEQRRRSTRRSAAPTGSTLAGSMMPALSMSTYSPVAASRPWPVVEVAHLLRPRRRPRGRR